MSSAHTTPQPRDDAAASTIDPNKTAKFLANLQRTVGRPRDPDDGAAAQVTAPAPAPVAQSIPSTTRAVEPPAVVKPTPTVADVQPARAASGNGSGSRAGKRSKSEKLAVEVTLDPGTASRVVYIRVDKTLADRLALIAFQNKINGGDGPATINDIGVTALNRWLDEYEQAA